MCGKDKIRRRFSFSGICINITADQSCRLSANQISAVTVLSGDFITRRKVDDHIGSCIQNHFQIILFDTTINFNICGQSSVIQHLTQCTDLICGFRNICLSAKSRFYRHQKYHIYLIQQRFQNAERSLWFNGNTYFYTFLSDHLDGFLHILTCFIMNRDNISTALYKFINIAVWILDHQMYIQNQIRDLTDRLQNRHTKRNARNKHAIHNIVVQILGSTLLRCCNIVSQMCKICG